MRTAQRSGCTEPRRRGLWRSWRLLPQIRYSNSQIRFLRVRSSEVPRPPNKLPAELRGEGAPPQEAWEAVTVITKAEYWEANRSGSRASYVTELPWSVILHNDRNLINRMVWRLWRTIPGMIMKRATSVTWEAYTKGREVAKTCHKELAELYEERLREKGLLMSIEPTR